MNTILLGNKKITPSKIICIGRNYAKHAAELGNELSDEMVVFVKPNSSLTTVLSSFHEEPLHYEGEIALLVEGGQFAGVGFGLDLTKRKLQSVLKGKGLPWERAKGFNGAAVVDRFVALPAQVDFSGLSLELSINGQVRQRGSVKDMLFKPKTILNDLISFISLEDGDIVMTGTPEGVGEVELGATFMGRIFLGDDLLIESTWLAQ